MIRAAAGRSPKRRPEQFLPPVTNQTTADAISPPGPRVPARAPPACGSSLMAPYRAEGLGATEIAKRLGIARASVYRLMQRGSVVTSRT
jgi:hypothetical protein